VIMGDSEKQPQVVQTQNSEDVTQNEEPKKDPETVAVDSDNILNSKGCLGCHAVESLDLQGGATGPDLSKAFEGVEDKHGKPIDEFLKEPTSAVMSSVISGSPLTDDERAKVVEMLKQASEK
jgi:cytochrome c551/c552